MTSVPKYLKIKCTMARRGEGSPSVARALSALEITDLSLLALGLPDSWVATIEPPHGQVAITPRRGRVRYHRAYVADGGERRIYRDDGLRAW